MLNGSFPGVTLMASTGLVHEALALVAFGWFPSGRRARMETCGSGEARAGHAGSLRDDQAGLGGPEVDPWGWVPKRDGPFLFVGKLNKNAFSAVGGAYSSNHLLLRASGGRQHLVARGRYRNRLLEADAEAFRHFLRKD